MGDTGQVKVRVRSADDLLAVAEALEHEAANRYRELSARMTQQGDNEMAAQFDDLARMEEHHANQVADRSVALLGHRPELARVRWETPPGYDEDDARGAQLSPYQALAFAVRNEERAFAFYSYVAAEAGNANDIRKLAEDLARDELHHAALLRRYRRRAFHRDRPVAFVVPQSVGELHALARLWEAEAAKAHGDLAERLQAEGGRDAAIFRHLAASEADSASGLVVETARQLGSAADGLRLLEEYFDRYALIAERAQDETVMAEAQRLADQTVSRLASVGGARNNALLNP